jgi:hypothetical protein
LPAYRRKDGPFEERTVGVLGLAEPVREPLDAVTDHQIVERLPPDRGEIQQARLDRCRVILRRAHASISGMGWITGATRQTRSALVGCASMNLRARHPSFSASTATSRRLFGDA